MANIMNYVIDELKDKLDKYEGILEYGCDLYFTLYEEENANGTSTFSTNDAINWIGEYFSDLGEVVSNLEFNIGAEFIPNPFLEPEKFMVVCLVEVASRLLSQCEFIDSNWNDEFELNAENIATIKSQLDEQRDTTYVA